MHDEQRAQPTTALTATSSDCVHESACATRNYRTLIVECLDCGKQIEITMMQMRDERDVRAIVALTFGPEIAAVYSLGYRR